MVHACTSTSHIYHATLRLAFGELIELWHRSINYAAGAIVKQCNYISTILCATLRYCQTTQTISIVLLRHVVIATERSTDRPCAFDMFDTTRSFTHMSNTCVIGRLAFLHLGFVDLMPCFPLSATLHILAFWFVHEPQNVQIALIEVGDYQVIVSLCNWACILGLD